MANKKAKLENIENFDAGYLFNKGENYKVYNFLGCHRINDSEFIFRVWAPRAKNVQLIGDFNNWEPSQMTLFKNTGIWEIIIPCKQGDLYKFKITTLKDEILYKADPMAKRSELRPNTASMVWELKDIIWSDKNYLKKRKMRNTYINPVNIYEVNLGSWMKHPDGRFYSYLELKDKLIDYVKDMGYTHIEIMPITEYPNDESWGYQVTGYFSITSRFGTPEEFMEFVNACHKKDIGVILDWVPSHFVLDSHGLKYFDGTATYEYEDYNKAFNEGWGTLHFDLGKTEVNSFLISNAFYFLEKFHIDGLRCDAVSSMLYLDYGDKKYTPNKIGTNINLEAVEFFKKINTLINKNYSGVLMIAEESTAYDGITKRVEDGGLGFTYKWNMGWMNDILRYIEMPIEERIINQKLANFSFIYTHNEKYILPLSHDEVVHGKKSIVDKAQGDLYKKFATMRLLISFMFLHPGKKLNFMTNDIAQFMEWRYYSELEWVGLQNERHRGMKNLFYTLNEMYKNEKSLYELEMEKEGINVLDSQNDDLLIKFLRRGKKKRDFIATCFNFSSREIHKVKIGVPYEGVYEEIVNTEKEEFGGTWTKGQGTFKTIKEECNNMPYCIEIISPALSGIIIKPKKLKGER